MRQKTQVVLSLPFENETRYSRLRIFQFNSQEINTIFEKYFFSVIFRTKILLLYTETDFFKKKYILIKIGENNVPIEIRTPELSV